ncbi:MAG: hypothetical protein EKK68_06285 [Candidatus Competibacteraceae bacterium]|nr:MAG: hypothetical protein EKK68_06285 [Candidatus Competibacteraceae bacterium]
MGIKFDPLWKVADPYYVYQFGDYQAFLDSVNQQQIMQALWMAVGHFRDPWVREILEDASSRQGLHDVIVEQGVHQPENLMSGGFTLHFTIRNDRGRAYHLYIKQKDNGTIYINEISFKRYNQFVSVFYE